MSSTIRNKDRHGGNASAEMVLSASLTDVINFSVQSSKPRYQSLFVITPKRHPPSLNLFHLIFKPRPISHALPSCHPISTPHLSFICVPQHRLVFIPSPFKTESTDSTFPTDCALTLQKTKGIISILIIHVWWEALAFLNCKPRNLLLSENARACLCARTRCAFLCQCGCLDLKVKDIKQISGCQNVIRRMNAVGIHHTTETSTAIFTISVFQGNNDYAVRFTFGNK